MYVFIIFLLTFALFRVYIVTVSPRVSEVLTGQYSRNLPVCSRRGFILDRNNEPINAEKDGFVCLVSPSLCANIREVSEKLSSLSGQLESEIFEKMRKGIPFTLRISEFYNGDGIYCYNFYNDKIVCATHLVGYTSPDGDGKSGIELSFNSYLSDYFSASVSYRYNANVKGIPLPDIGSSIIDKGYSELSGVVTTIDKNFQLFCEESAKSNMTMGAVCVSDIKTGEILASVSLPDFEEEKISSYLTSTNGEFINRCAKGFTPGSVFKTVVACAALEYSQSLYNLEYECKGYYETEEGEIFSCHNKKGHGKLTMNEAYSQSCNPYFINLATKIGADRILALSQKMGLSQSSLLEGICRYKGNLPKNTSDSEGFLANLAIGQGSLLLCPYEALNIYSCAATGYYYKPMVVKSLFRGDYIIKEYNREKNSVLSEKTVKKLREMMADCILSGLGSQANPDTGDAGGKTATAQTGQYKDGKELLNKWFCGVYPISDPKYAICVLCDGNGKEGNAKLVFRDICNYLSEESVLFDNEIIKSKDAA